MKPLIRTGRWVIAIFGREGYFWDYVKDIRAADPYRTPYVFPNRPSAAAYAAWKLDWAKDHGYRDTYGMRVLDLSDPEAVGRLDIAWTGAMGGLLEAAQKSSGKIGADKHGE